LGQVALNRVGKTDPNEANWVCRVFGVELIIMPALMLVKEFEE
jgi:hypothetical protein